MSGGPDGPGRDGTGTAGEDPAYPDSGSRRALEPGCARCPELAAARERIAWGNGPADADAVVVGEAPGAGDPDAERWRGGNWTGLAYTSAHSGRRVRRTMAAAGYADRAYYTNAVKCFPADGEGSNREPTDRERSNCRPYLAAEIERVDPAVLVPTGRHATASVLALDGRDLGGFLDRVLDPVHVERFDLPAVPLLHPSYREVWLPRLGLDLGGYRERLRALLP